MCFVVPLRVEQVKETKAGVKAKMEDGRVVRSLVKDIKIGDYLVCQQDMGVDKLSSRQAWAMRQAIKGVSDEISKGS